MTGSDLRVTVNLFARARDLCGQQAVNVQLQPGASVGDLRNRLVAEYPALARLSPHLMFAIACDYVADSTLLEPGADIACFPPVSGG